VSLQTHAPLDAVVISLGTNDLFVPGVNAYHVAHGAMKLAEVALLSGAGPAGVAPMVLVVVPPPFAPLGTWGGESPDGERESQGFGEAFRVMAADYGGVPLLDLREHVMSSALDGIHFEAADHHVIGVAVAGRLRELLGL
jgi:lysophospholipase L1-like esterase